VTKIFVTGPQRSGSTFVANCLSIHFGIPLIDEMEFDAHFYGMFKFVASKHESWVVHGPALFHKVFDVLSDFPDVTFVIVRRDVEEILRSQERIHWDPRIEEIAMNKESTDTRPVAQMKYDCWDKWKKIIPSYVEYQYSDFKNHPLWVPEDKRKNFLPKQWKVDESAEEIVVNIDGDGLDRDIHSSSL